ncbi:MAG: hypothetical protein HY741_00260 [Chloroflexi bacterium]|nr:hypothetical protein [Chloroflexota bacterium]
MSSASETYWNNYSVNERDVERVYAFMLEKGEAVRTADLARVVIAARAHEEEERRRRLSAQAVLYQPKLAFETGQRLIFSALNDVEGTVTSIRASDNPRLKPFRVAAVKFGDGLIREFACEYDLPHPLNEVKPIATGAADESPDEIQARFGPRIERLLTARLRGDKEFVEQAGKWLLRGLLTDVNVGFLNIAEAAIEQNNAGMTTPELARVLELDTDVAKHETTLFSLDYALQRDDRFVDVGPSGQTRWYLNRLVPADVWSVPRVLQFGAPSKRSEPLPPELETILSEIQDDNNDDEAEAHVPATVNVILTYPHRRAGSLPLTQGVRALFPLADKPMLIALLDEYGVRIPAWVAPEENYIFGLKAWYDRSKLNPGALLELAPHPDPLTAVIRFQPRREGKSLWVKIAKVESGHLTFGTSPRPVAYKYDEEMLILPEDQNGLDKLSATNYGDRPLELLLADIFPELVKLGSSSIHAKTLYSAVNFAKRVGARAVFNALANSEAFTTTGGGYFVLQMAARPAQVFTEHQGKPL